MIETAERLRQINNVLGYRFQGRFATGEHHSASSVSDAKGTAFFLKYHAHGDILLRARGLAKGLFYSSEDAALRTRLRQQIIQIPGDGARLVCLAYNVLAQLGGSIRHHMPEAVATWLPRATWMLDREAAEP